MGVFVKLIYLLLVPSICHNVLFAYGQEETTVLPPDAETTLEPSSSSSPEDLDSSSSTSTLPPSSSSSLATTDDSESSSESSSSSISTSTNQPSTTDASTETPSTTLAPESDPWLNVTVPDYQDHSITDYPATPEKSDFRWYVFIAIYDDPNNLIDGRNCSGALVSYNSILTAASCLYRFGENYRFKTATLLIGGTYLTNPIYKVTVGLARSAFVHPSFDPLDNKLRGNLAIISIYDGIEPNRYIEPIEIASYLPDNRQLSYQLPNHDYYGETQRVVNNLGYRYMFLNPQFKCRWFYGSEVCDGSVLTAFSKYKNDAILCQVGSGAPLSAHTLIEPYKKAKLVGISSFVSADGCDGAPGGYTSVIHYHKWLMDNI